MSFRGCERNWSGFEGMKEVEDWDLKKSRRIIERFNGSFGLVNEPVNGLAWSVIAKALLNIIELYSSLSRKQNLLSLGPLEV
ncbi:hypothetical protein M0R45_021389 [Rubus argutus]|uniref:Uncharacterized protein n=1 Tax=Rubus argutus TaxID=59490 RepID=A0AAW1XCI3_RUBAR